MQLQSEGPDDLEDGRELRIPLGRKRLVETLAAEAGLPGDLRHALGPCDAAKGYRDEGGVPFFEGGLQLRRHVLLEMLSSHCFMHARARFNKIFWRLPRW